MGMKKIILFLVFCFSFLSKAEFYNFSRLDNTHGLSNNQIESIFKDSRGFMWFGTNYGLNRYDGNQVIVYKTIKNDTTSLSFNSISRIQEDFEGNLWLSNAGNGAYIMYDIHTEKFIRNLVTLLSPLGIHFLPTIIEIDKQKNFYFYDPNNGIFKYDINQKKCFKIVQGDTPNSISKGIIIRLKIEEGSIWVLFQSGLIERYNEKQHTVDFRNNYVAQNATGAFIQKNIYIDSDGCPWVYPGIGDRGVLYYDMANSQWIYFGKDKKDIHHAFDKSIFSDFVRDVAQDKNGRIWIATDHGGVNVYEKTSGQITALRNDPLNQNSISQNSDISLYCDNTGIMWVGTYKNGVCYYHPDMFKFEKSPLFFYHNLSMENKDCNTLYKDRYGNLWIGTNGSGLLKLDKSSGKFKLFQNRKDDPSSISSDIIISSLEDRKGNMWFGTFLGGLNQMVGDKFIQYEPDVKNQNSLSNKSIYGLAEDSKQNLWIATLGGGVDQLEADRKTFHKHQTFNVPGLSSNVILSMFSKSANIIYLSTTNGIDILNTSSNNIMPLFRSNSQLNKLSDLVIYNTLVDSRNLIWIATDNGINIYNPKQHVINYIDQSGGLPSEQVVSLIEDKNGNIWAGTRNGLACINTKFNKTTKNYSYSVVSFDENDGLLGSIFNQNAIYKDKDGKIFIGCTKGYTVFDPKTIHFNRLIPQPKFTEFIIGNKVILPNSKFNGRIILNETISKTKKIILHYDEKNFTVSFSALNYIHPEKNRYRYQLKGFDENWTTTKNNIGTATYTNLNRGTYELIVYASNNDNKWSSIPLVLEIIIQPPFWWTWWAIIIYIALGMAAIWYIVNFNLRKQKREFENAQRVREAKQLHEVDELKFKFFTNISHEFRTPLTLIINPAEKMLQQARSDDDKNLLSIILRNANSLLDLVNQLLDFRKLDVQKDTLNHSVGDVVSFIKDICYSFTELANRKSILYSFSTAIAELRMEFDSEKLQKIVFNLLSNAFKFTPENGKIDVNLSLIQQINDDKKLLKIAITDSGIGIPAKDLDRIFERFYRVENPENGHQTGTGVGLHIVSEYVKLHDGFIGVESTPGKGSIFTVHIPAKQHIQEEIISQNNDATCSSTDEMEDNPQVSEEIKSKFPLMLVVDDNEDFRNFISAMFSDSYHILKAENGERALKITLEKMPDLIICDVMMPKIDGFEFCKLVKNDIRISHIPIILLTAKAGDENKYRGIEAGAEDYIAKPFNMEMLSLKVSRIIERQRKTREQFKRKVEITTAEVEITSMDEKFVKKAVALVETNISNSEFLVEDLCREMGMSRVYFYKKILSLTDKTPSEFIRFIRLKRAADLLEKSQLFVNEVAYQVGFNDPKYFRKYFKDEFGISPNDYKKRFIN